MDENIYVHLSAQLDHRHG